MTTLCLVFSAIYGITSVKSVYTQFEYDYTTSVCSVQECNSCCYSDCTELVPITGTVAQDYISNTDGRCMDEMSCDVSEWVWPQSYYNDPPTTTDSSCACPICSCDTLGAIEYFKKVDDSSAYCYACECSALPTYTYGDGITAVNGYESCDTVSSYYFDSEVPSFPCPPPRCGPFDGETYYPDDTWWNQTNPESYCLCQDDGTPLCSQSYEEILSDSLLNDEFDECSSDLRGTCRTDASKWFNPQTYNAVECPKCGCDTEGEIAYFTRTNDYGSKHCYECPCVAWTNANRTGYDCASSSIYSLSSTELEDKSWSCPPVSCDYNGDTKWEGDDWWDDSDSDCKTFCVCQSDGNAVCSTTYAEIVGNDVLFSAFSDDCDYYLPDSCMSDPTRWSDDSSYYCGCPQCDCVSDTDTWYEAWTDAEALESDASDLSFMIFGGASEAYHCDICSCVDGETECDEGVSAAFDLSEQCDATSITKCYEGDALDDLDQAYCPPSDYCSHKRDSDDSEWGCGEPFLCDVLGLADSTCVSASYQRTMYWWAPDSDSDSNACELVAYPTMDYKEFTSCCKGDNCNDYKLNKKECESNALYTHFASQQFECTFGSQAYMRTYGAIAWQLLAAFGWYIGGECELDADALGFAQEPCNGVRDFVMGSYLCPCGMYGSLYNAPGASESTKTAIKSYMNSIGTGELDAMNVQNGCGLVYTCDVAEGTAVLTDEDYVLAFDLEAVNCMDPASYSCVTANEYMYDVYAASNISAPLAGITVSGCSFNSGTATLSVHVETTFGGSVMRDLAEDAMDNDLMIWSDNSACTATISGSATTQTINTEDFDGDLYQDDGAAVHLFLFCNVIVFLLHL
eukprot:729033_1